MNIDKNKKEIAIIKKKETVLYYKQKSVSNFGNELIENIISKDFHNIHVVVCISNNSTRFECKFVIDPATGEFNTNEFTLLHEKTLLYNGNESTERIFGISWSSTTTTFDTKGQKDIAYLNVLTFITNNINNKGAIKEIIIDTIKELDTIETEIRDLISQRELLEFSIM